MFYEPNLYRMTACVQCGKQFIDDCGDVFCSGSCENRWEADHACCQECGEESDADLLNEEGICESCEENEITCFVLDRI